MLELRIRAWRFFEEMPWPTGTEETWRRTKLTGFKLEDYVPLVGALSEGAGAQQRFTEAPSFVNPIISERATRLWAISPTIAIVRPSILPLCSITVIISSSPWLGCS